MRRFAMIRRRPAGAADRARFHTAALLVIFAALAWISDTWEDRPQPRTAKTMPDGCRLAASRSSGAIVSDQPLRGRVICDR